MSNSKEVATTMTAEEYAALAARSGMYVPKPATLLPRVSVNRDPEVGPMGKYAVMQRQGEDKVWSFADTGKFRCFINTFQYQEYDPKANEFINRSIIFKDFREEAHDEKGGLACGKVKRDLLETLSPEEQFRQRNIKCNRLMYGLVTLGNEDGVVELPAMWKLAGSNFMAPKDAFAAIVKQKSQNAFHDLLMKKPVRQKQGATVYYSIELEAVLGEKHILTDDDYQTFDLFEEVIERENNWVLNKWRDAKKKALGTNDKSLMKSLELDDELPF